jgi:hypothetical protein
LKKRKRKPRRKQVKRAKKNRCDICGRPATHVCPLCGRSVCDQHWAGDKCVICSQALCAICKSNLSIATCPICGRPICEKCSIQVTPVIRVCVECARRYLKNGEWPPQELLRQDLLRLSRSVAKFLKKWAASPKFRER